MILRIKFFFLNLSFLFVFQACAPMSPGPHFTKTNLDDGDVLLVSETAHASTVSITSNGMLALCRANQPDATMTVSESAGADYTSKVKEALLGDTSSMDDEMVGRSPALLALREIMYRSCELTENNDLSKAEAIAIYKHSLKLAIKPVLQEAKSGQVDVTENLTTTRSISQNNQLVDSSLDDNQNNSNSTSGNDSGNSSQSGSDPDDHSGGNSADPDPQSGSDPDDDSGGNSADPDPQSGDSSSDDCKDGETYDDVMGTCLPD